MLFTKPRFHDKMYFFSSQFASLKESCFNEIITVNIYSLTSLIYFVFIVRDALRLSRGIAQTGEDFGLCIAIAA